MSLTTYLDILATFVLGSCSIWFVAGLRSKARRGSNFSISNKPNSMPLAISHERGSIITAIEESIRVAERVAARLDRLEVQVFVTSTIDLGRKLVNEAAESLRLAQWLEEQIPTSQQRATNSASQAVLERIRQRVADLDAEARRIAETMAHSEVLLLALLSETDVSPAISTATDVVELLECQYETTAQLNQEIRRMAHVELEKQTRLRATSDGHA